MDDLSPATDPVDLVLPDPSVERDDAGDPVAVDGEVLAIDRFGNVVTNVPGELIRGRDWVRINGELTPVAETFGAVDSGDRLVTVGSHGYVECDVNDGAATARSTSDPGVGTARRRQREFVARELRRTPTPQTGFQLIQPFVDDCLLIDYESGCCSLSAAIRYINNRERSVGHL